MLPVEGSARCGDERGAARLLAVLGSERVRRKFIERCEELNIPVTRLSSYSIENYFSLSALREIFKSQIPQSVTSIDPSVSLEDQIGIDVKKNNRKLAQKTELSDIRGTDLYDFLEQVREVCES